MPSSTASARSLPADRATATPDLLERDAELAALDRLVAEAADGRGRLVLIEGPAGIGKSGLLGGLRRRAGEEARVLAARASELEREFAFGVVRQLFESVVAERPDAALGGAAAPAAAVFAGQPAAADGGAQFAVLHGLYWLTLNLAAERPLLLAIDDLHWADRPSLRFLAYLARRLDGVPALAAATLRSGDHGADPQLLAEIALDPATRALRPGPLGPDAVAALARAELGDSADPAFCAACHEATGGNPLLLRQLLRTLEAEGVLPDAAHVGAVRAVGPRAVSSTVLLRLARLPADAAAVTRAVSVLGEGAKLPVVAALAGLDEEAVAATTAALVRAEILRAETPLGFVHPLVRDAVYHELSPAERELAHERAAGILRDHRAPDEQIAAQLLMAPPRGEPWVAELLEAAGGAAMRRAAVESAVAYLARALEEPPPPDRHDAVLLALGHAEAHTDGPAAVGHLRAVYARRTDPHTALALGHLLLFVDREREAAQLLRAAAAALPPEQDDLRGLLEAVELTTYYFGGGDADIRRRLAERPRGAPGRSLGERARTAAAVLDWAHRNEPADACAEAAIAALDGGELIEAFQGGTVPIAPMMVLVWADREDGLAALDELRVVAHRSGSLFSANGLHMFRGFALAARGDLAAAEEEIRTAVENSRSWGFGDLAAQTFIRGFLCSTLVERGDLAGAREALGPEPLGHDHEGVRFWLLGRLQLLVAARDDEAAVAAAEELGERYAWITNPAVSPWRSLAAQALARLDRRDDAVALAVEELELARGWGAPGALGRALRVLGTLEDDPVRLEASVAALEGSIARLELAKSLAALGSARRRARQPAEARAPLRRALELAAACAAPALAEHVRTELYAAGARPRTDALAGVAALTASERRVADLAAAGETNRDIAQALYVTPKTVEVHLSNAYRKLGIRSRRELPAALTP
jgi:DNA-binding CsgD family transcriptional regulator